LENLRADFNSQAAAKENEARDLEDRMLQLRAEAAGLRHGGVGLGEALELYAREVGRAKEFRSMRDGDMQPDPEITNDYSSYHANAGRKTSMRDVHTAPEGYPR
jgi:hypothetical protein